MTETELKLQDAGTQMRIAIANSGDELIFRSCINAYVALARSVTMVMERESGEAALKQWYKASALQLGQSPVFKFFNSQRVYSIHKGVVTPKSSTFQTEEVSFWYEQSAAGKKTLVGTITIPGDPLPFHPYDIVSVDCSGEVMVWQFDNIREFMPDDSGNVLRLCESYFVGLKWLVQEWVKRRQSPMQ